MKIKVRWCLGLVAMVCGASLRVGVSQKPIQPESPARTFGTLNLILASKQGAVIATDSRMSSESSFSCDGRAVLFCDNSQKLFWATPHSAVAIAGFAVGRAGTPIDLGVAPVLRGISANGPMIIPAQHADRILALIGAVLEPALADLAAIYPPDTDPQSLSLTITMVRLDPGAVPVLQQLQLQPNWGEVGRLRVALPRYSSVLTPSFSASDFLLYPVGITFVADAIRSGVYKSMDPAIQSYYRRRKNHSLNDMTVQEMADLARAILHETQKLTDYVGGGDQIGVFPAVGKPSFQLPRELSKDTQSTARIMRWDGLVCKGSQSPPCGNPGISFDANFGQSPENTHYTKLFIGSEFTDNVSVLLDGNIFVANSFDGVTLRWSGRPFSMFRSTFHHCVLETFREVNLADHPELMECRLVKKISVEVPAESVGLPIHDTHYSNGAFSIPAGILP